MAKATTAISFETRLLQPAAPAGAAWAFVVLPAAASSKLPTRSMVSVDGTLAGQAFQATLEPDGQGSHWLKVERALRQAAGVAVGQTVSLTMTPVSVEPEPAVPADLRDALEAHPEARATWDDITATARRDWIYWITSGKKAQTRVKRVATACDMLAQGKRRACCFDRSGLYSRRLGAPQATTD
ncbi:MAG: YdeI/OmpD-associated family protein [Pseudoxanthomonas sp.]